VSIAVLLGTFMGGFVWESVVAALDIGAASPAAGLRVSGIGDGRVADFWHCSGCR